ncbi:RND transporter, partial [Acinetobacter baumannii]
LLTLLLAGCVAAPNYQRPVAEVPLKWQSESPWRDANPQDALPKGAWWKIYENETLNNLQQRALEHNQTVAIARARLIQIRALAQSSEAST